VSSIILFSYQSSGEQVLWLIPTKEDLFRRICGGAFLFHLNRLDRTPAASGRWFPKGPSGLSPQLLKLGAVWITRQISCTLTARLFGGLSVRIWKKQRSLVMIVADEALDLLDEGLELVKLWLVVIHSNPYLFFRLPIVAESCLCISSCCDRDTEHIPRFSTPSVLSCHERDRGRKTIRSVSICCAFGSPLAQSVVHLVVCIIGNDCMYCGQIVQNFVWVCESWPRPIKCT
jgi:hypothetical protein